MILSYSVFGQTKSDTITVKSSFGVCKIYQSGRQITLAQLATAVQSNDLAYKQVKKAQSTNVFSTIIGGAGAIMIGYPLGTSVAGGKANWTMFGIGVGLTIISFPIINKCIKQVHSSVDIYYDGLKKKSQPTTEFKLGLSGNGMTIAMSF